MTNYVKVNGEWVKQKIYAVVDAVHTRFTSNKFTATNVGAALEELADSKQNTLTAGENITIENDVISAEGGAVDPGSTVEFVFGYDSGGLYVVTEDENE